MILPSEFMSDRTLGLHIFNEPLNHCHIRNPFRNALGGPMPTNIQATFTQGQDVIVNVTLTAHHKGHFEFAVCAISSGEVPTKGVSDKIEFI